MDSLTLCLDNPVIYFDRNDDPPFNVLLANSLIVERYATLDEAVAAFRQLIQETED